MLIQRNMLRKEYLNTALTLRPHRPKHGLLKRDSRVHECRHLDLALPAQGARSCRSLGSLRTADERPSRATRPRSST
jgi:hypothetical protein